MENNKHSRRTNLIFLRLLAVAVFAMVGLVVLGGRTTKAMSVTWDISADVKDYQAAVNLINRRCNEGWAAAHAGYISSKSLNTSTGVISWNISVLYRRCSSGAVANFYAVTGYDGICPLAGWYHHGSDGTYDCVKHMNPARLAGTRFCGGRYPINDCWQYGNWWNRGVYRGDNPPSTSLQSAGPYSFSAQIPNWSSVRSGGRYNFLTGQSLCNYWQDGNRKIHAGDQCQGFWATVWWQNQWSVSGQSYVGDASNSGNAGNRGQGENARIGRPGQTFQWDHTLKNNGPDNMFSNVSVNINYSYQQSSGMGSHKGNNGSTFYTNHNKRTLSQSDVGTKLCQSVSWKNKSWNDGNWGSSSRACVNVPYHFTLQGTTNMGGIRWRQVA